MDTSETYIKMSELLPSELKREMFERDLVKYLVEGIVIDHRGNYWSVKGNSIGWVATQLLKQDQLQEMLHSTDWISTFEKFVLWAFHPDPMKCEIYYGMGISHNVFSMEQLWLAFVMKTLYSKVWDGNEWKKMEKEGSRSI